MCKLKVFLVCFLIYIINISESKSISEDVEFEYFRDFIDDIKSQMDDNAKPCQDFKQFACGNLIKQQDKQSQLIDYVSHNLTNLSENEKIIKIMYNLPQKELNIEDIPTFFSEVEFLNIFKEWPVADITITDEDIIRLLVEISYLDTFYSTNNTFLSIHRAEHSTHFSIRHKEYFNRSVYLEGITEAMEKFGASSDSAESAISDIEIFLNEADLILNEKLSLENNLVTDFEEVNKTLENFDWSLFFKIYTENLNLDQNTFQNITYYITGAIKVQKLLNLIANTNRKTFTNYLIWSYIKSVQDIILLRKPHDLIDFGKTILYQDLLENYFNEYDKDNEIETIDQFQKSLSAYEGTTLNLRVEPTNNFFNNRRALLAEQRILSRVRNDLTNFQISEDDIYNNFIKIEKCVLRIFIKYHENDIKLLGGLFDASDIDLDAHNKPMLYYFAHDFMVFSSKLRHYIKFLGNFNNTGECLPDDRNELKLYRVFTITNTYGSYMRWLKENDGDLMDRMNDYLEEVGLTQTQALWVAMEQQFCSEGETHLENVLTKVRAFAQDFDCEHSCH